MDIVVIGLGRVWQHYENIISSINKKINVTTVIDQNESLIDKYSKKYDCKSFKTVDEFIQNNTSPKPDLAFVLTPSGEHYHDSKNLLINGINVITEKPSTLIPEQTIELGEIAKEKNLLYSCVFQNRYNKAIIKAKELIDSGLIGKVVSCSAAVKWCRDQNYYNDGWHGSWRMDGGVLSQQAIHHVDAMRFLNGEVSKVCGYGTRLSSILQAEDTFCGSLVYKNGSCGSILATTAIRPKDRYARVVVSAINGEIIIGGVCMNTLEKLTIGEKSFTLNELKEHSEIVNNGYGNGHKDLFENILEVFSSDNKNDDFKYKSLIRYYDFYKTIELVSSFYASWEKSKWIDCSSKEFSEKLGY